MNVGVVEKTSELDVESEEVFEEAIDTQEHLQERHLNNDLNSLPLNHTINAEAMSDLESFEDKHVLDACQEAADTANVEHLSLDEENIETDYTANEIYELVCRSSMHSQNESQDDSSSANGLMPEIIGDESGNGELDSANLEGGHGLEDDDEFNGETKLDDDTVQPKLEDSEYPNDKDEEIIDDGEEKDASYIPSTSLHNLKDGELNDNSPTAIVEAQVVDLDEPKPPTDSNVSRDEQCGKNVEIRNICSIVEEPKPDVEKQLDKEKIDRQSQPSKKSENSARPAGLGRASPLLEPTPRSAQPPRVNGSNGLVSQIQTQSIDEPATSMESEEKNETREKLQMIRVKFLRLAHRLGQTPHNVVVAQVLYRLGLAEQLRGRNGGPAGAFSFDRASAVAENLEGSATQEPLDFSCTMMLLGKTGVGKSATINSIFDEPKFGTDAFISGTKKVQDVIGTVEGIRVRVIDTPGLLPSGCDQRANKKILRSVKNFIGGTPPDIVLYLDRLDMQSSREFGDTPLLRTVTETFGPSIWFNAIVVLTHAASAPPDGPNGMASSYDTFVTQRSHLIQQAVRHAAGDMRLMNPVSLVENHSACRTNRAGQRVLPNGQVWKPHLLLLSFASKILAEANALLKLQDTPPGKNFGGARSKSPPLPFLLSSLIQARPRVKLPDEHDDLDELSDTDDESSECGQKYEYDELPAFKSLTKDEIRNLGKDQRRAYFDEMEYREKLLIRKQLREAQKQRRMMKEMSAEENAISGEEESAPSATVPVSDLVLPASFDSDNPTHRYRFMESSNRWVVRPVLDTHGWDHDVGYDGINAEKVFAVRDNKIPVSVSGQITKDKKDANLQVEVSSSVKHGQGKTTSVGLDVQSIGKDMIYTMRGETQFGNLIFRTNKAAAGVSVTLLGDSVSGGVKVEERFAVGRRLRVVATGGAMTGRGDAAYGGSVEATLRDEDHPLGRSLSSFGVSVMDWHGDVAVGANAQSQVPVGRFSNLIMRGNLNNRGSGQISVRFNSSEQWTMVLLGVVPLIRKILAAFDRW